MYFDFNNQFIKVKRTFAKILKTTKFLFQSIRYSMTTQTFKTQVI